MKCHYEVLGVAQNASDSELKKAYYKMALQWHPDKNPDRMEEAKTQFQLIQAAYDTLSDPQERAFYDRNRESILRGKASEGNSKPETLDIFKYFSSQCYSGFNDSEKGFYTVYRQVFEKVAVLDMQYMNDEEEIFIPGFGQSDTDLEDVGRFYAYWSSYCSSMDFRWADEYDIREAQRMGRWVEKKIEKDNNKARQRARRQFNEEVRALVAYVRKRDKRWLERKKKINAKIAENAQKQLACQQRQREERQKSMKEHVDKERANLAAYEEQLKLLEGQFAREWGMTDTEESDYSEEGEAQEGAEGPMEDQKAGEEPLLDELYCVACNKTFKTEKAMKNHQRSKKHKENLEALKAAMNAEDREYFNSSTFSVETEQQNEESAVPAQKTSKKKKKKKSSQETLPVSQATDFIDQKKKKKKKDIISPGISGFSSEDSDGETVAQSPNNLSDDVDASSKSMVVDQSASCDGVNSGKTSDAERVVNGDSGLGKSVSCGEEDKDEEERLEAKPKLKGKKAKDAKKRAKEASSAVEPEAKEIRCTMCGNIFTSKNKLFQHIKKEGHAALKTIGKETRGKAKGK